MKNFDITDNSIASRVARDVIAERRRQIEAEGWSPAHDDKHADGSIAAAAGTYVLVASGRFVDVAKKFWPWDFQWWKPCGPRRNLVKAAALILAEIERLDRAEIAQICAEADRDSDYSPI